MIWGVITRMLSLENKLKNDKRYYYSLAVTVFAEIQT